MKNLSISLSFLIILLLILVHSVPCNADPVEIKWEPTAVTEVFEVDYLDDDVDVYSLKDGAVQLTAGQKLVWDYKYKKGPYKVLSGDLADIEKLSFFASGNVQKFDVSVWLTGLEGDVIGPMLKVANLSLASAYHKEHAVIYISNWWEPDPPLNGADVLGNLENKVIDDFHVEINIIEGDTLSVNKINFLWEVMEIKQIPEPSTSILLGIGLACIALLRRKTLNG